MNVAYVRVSTVEQNEERQIEGLRKYNIEKWFEEKVSGKDANRPKLREMLDFVREKDTVYVHDFSRLARSTKDLLERQREGIAVKKEQDKSLPPEKRTYKGRKPIHIPNFAAEYEKYCRREMTKVQLAKKLGVSRPTLDKLIAEHERMAV